MKSYATILLYSSHGQASFCSEGLLVDDKLDPKTYEPISTHPFKLDIPEWKARYPNESAEGEWDILDWSYWTRAGDYCKYVDTSDEAA